MDLEVIASNHYPGVRCKNSSGADNYRLLRYEEFITWRKTVDPVVLKAVIFSDTGIIEL